MNEIINTVSTNPSIAGFALFVLVFLPLLAYVIRWAEKSTGDLKNTYENVLAKSEKREEKLTHIINVSIADTTKVLTKMDKNLTLIHGNMNNLACRVESIEKSIEMGNE